LYTPERRLVKVAVPGDKIDGGAACMFRYFALALIILFLASVARFYDPTTGFTAFIAFPRNNPREAPRLQDIPHHTSSTSYDGQFYAQRALDPLLRDPEVDGAMDLAPFRARRILFSWTAYIAGLGRPAWILQAYALQNVVCWLLLALLLARWMPVATGRGVLLWASCLFSHGMLWSVRYALLDGPSLLLTASAVALVERGRPLLSAALVGVAALARETNVLFALAQPSPRDRRTWLRSSVAAILVVLPLLLWLDYLRSIYRSTTSAGTGLLVLPGTALVDTWWDFLRAAVRDPFSGDGLLYWQLFALGVQAAYLLVRREYQSPWWRVAAGYAVLMLLLDRTLSDPHTGAITRVLLPLTVGFNVLLANESRASRFWPWAIAGNLHLLPATRIMAQAW
jgi:hypothetical protein